MHRPASLPAVEAKRALKAVTATVGSGCDALTSALTSAVTPLARGEVAVTSTQYGTGVALRPYGE